MGEQHSYDEGSTGPVDSEVLAWGKASGKLAMPPEFLLL